jgi:hypothetical protein
MNDQVIITLDSCWYDVEEVHERLKELKNKYNITATFHDGGDYYSTMTYKGTKENIKKFLEVEYVPYFDEEDMDEEVLEIIRG